MLKKLFYLSRAIFAFAFSFLPLCLLEDPWRFIGKCIQNAENHRFSLNGEGRLVAKIAADANDKPLVIYDIGANIGKWSLEILKLKPDATIYAFEMIPTFAEKARQNLQPFPAAKVFNTPLSNESRKIPAFQHGGGAAITQNPYHAQVKQHTVRTENGDDFVKANNLMPPGFIKLDVDGHEYKVLQGLKNTIAAARPCIQFEYSFFYTHERVFLKDLFNFFEALDYELYQILPTKLVKRTYSTARENFWTVNYLAKPREKPPL